MPISPFADAVQSTVCEHAQVAQLVEQRIENPRVGGSIPPLGTIPNFSADKSRNTLNGNIARRGFLHISARFMHKKISHFAPRNPDHDTYSVLNVWMCFLMVVGFFRA